MSISLIMVHFQPLHLECGDQISCYLLIRQQSQGWSVLQKTFVCVEEKRKATEVATVVRSSQVGGQDVIVCVRKSAFLILFHFHIPFGIPKSQGDFVCNQQSIPFSLAYLDCWDQGRKVNIRALGKQGSLHGAQAPLVFPHVSHCPPHHPPHILTVSLQSPKLLGFIFQIYR